MTSRAAIAARAIAGTVRFSEEPPPVPDVELGGVIAAGAVSAGVAVTGDVVTTDVVAADVVIADVVLDVVFDVAAAVAADGELVAAVLVVVTVAARVPLDASSSTLAGLALAPFPDTPFRTPRGPAAWAPAGFPDTPFRTSTDLAARVPAASAGTPPAATASSTQTSDAERSALRNRRRRSPFIGIR